MSFRTAKKIPSSNYYNLLVGFDFMILLSTKMKKMEGCPSLFLKTVRVCKGCPFLFFILVRAQGVCQLGAQAPFLFGPQFKVGAWAPFSKHAQTNLDCGERTSWGSLIGVEARFGDLKIAGNYIPVPIIYFRVQQNQNELVIWLRKR